MKFTVLISLLVSSILSAPLSVAKTAVGVAALGSTVSGFSIDARQRLPPGYRLARSRLPYNNVKISFDAIDKARGAFGELSWEREC
jgi:hypothetical protein